MIRRFLLHSNGPALWPVHKPLPEVLGLKETTPERTWEGTYQGNPMSPAGSVFKRSWWTEGKNRYDWAEPRLVRKCIGRWLSFDTALKANDDSAYSTCMVVELWPDYRLALRHVWREKVEFPDLPPAISQLARRFNQDEKLRGVIIEDKASGISAIQTIRSSIEYNWISDILITFTPNLDKPTRAMQGSVWCKNGMVLLPHPGPDWLYDFEDELFGFPNSTYADQVDAFAQALLFLEHLLAEGFQLRAGNRPELIEGMSYDDGSKLP